MDEIGTVAELCITNQNDAQDVAKIIRGH